MLHALPISSISWWVEMMVLHLFLGSRCSLMHFFFRLSHREGNKISYFRRRIVESFVIYEFLSRTSFKYKIFWAELIASIWQVWRYLGFIKNIISFVISCTMWRWDLQYSTDCCIYEGPCLAEEGEEDQNSVGNGTMNSDVFSNGCSARVATVLMETLTFYYHETASV